MIPIQRVLVATDFGAAATRAVEVAAEVATRFASKVTVLHSIEDLSYASPCSVPPEIRQSAAFRLDETVKRMRRQVPAVEGMLREGFAWREITEAASEIAAGIVVVGSHGQGDGHRFLIGSVAEKVARVCAAPVLTVHAWRFENRTYAGRELAELLLRSDEVVPTVVAISRGGAMVGAEIAEAFGASLHVLLTRSVVRDGRVVGAVCEDGTVHLEAPAARPTCDRNDDDAMARAHAELLEEARRLRSPRWPHDAQAGTILVVSDAILTASPCIAAARALRRMGTHRLVAAAPAASLAAREALGSVFDRVMVVQMVDDGFPLARLYGDRSDPNDRAVIERLALARQWAQEIEKRP
jgi:putative phosphoribosyl transferase